MKCRILGVSEQPEVPTNVFITATGNHFQFRGDTVRRGVVATILSEDNQWDKSFSFDPVELALRTREEMVWGALVVMRAYHVAGRPGAGSLGSFEAWDRACGSAAWWALGSRAGCRATDTIAGRVAGDPEREDLEAVAVAWGRVFGDRAATLREALAAAEDFDLEAGRREAAEELLALLRSATGSRTNDARAMGHELRRVAGTRVETGAVFRQAGKGMHGKRYALVG
jgi:putative DNA primase/helicase